jgi:hypothetical protein
VKDEGPQVTRETSFVLVTRQRLPDPKKKKSRAKQHGTSGLEVGGTGSTELFSGLFCVAASRLNSPRFLSKRLYALRCESVKTAGLAVAGQVSLHRKLRFSGARK